ncbi:hypothetical protein MTBBW1_1790012 [Desulfamplus magnetovallimortis]|uniref:Uncharacterized protein n=1 Tax=Desulfamplus magnetovallimortis TaxID=1246637 RepID=A0A1W1HA83_9BACT|nr:hypothetical protein [Desulfamplus magnetovallimortis]SLM29387.1 hypothetical protein MTBBW1_1790012 [Desulfamplus magnetovallimortis]
MHILAEDRDYIYSQNRHLVGFFGIYCICLNQDNQDLQDAQDFYPVNPDYPGHPDSDSINKAHKVIGVVFEYISKEKRGHVSFPALHFLK